MKYILGDRVEILGGVFDGWIGTVCGYAGECTSLLSIACSQGSGYHVVQVHEDDLRPWHPDMWKHQGYVKINDDPVRL